MTTLPKTAEQIREMPAGAEMDRLVAEYVMGWLPHCRNTVCYVNAADVNKVMERDSHHHVSDWKPSANIAHAWEARAILSKMGKHIVLFTHEGMECCGIIGGMEPGFVSHGDHWIDESLDGVMYAHTAPLAICRAALLSVVES